MLNHNQIVALKPTNKTFKRGLGNGLTLVVDKQYKGKSGNLLGGRKYFKGRVKGTEVWLGTFGNNGGELSLKNAREKYFGIKDFCQKNKVSYAEYKREKNREKLSEWTLKDAIDHFLNECSNRIKQTTYREYKRKLNQVLNLIDGSTPIKELEWDLGGKERIEEVITKIENGGKGRNYDLARRCRNLLKQVFDGAIFKGKFTRGQNPASTEGRVVYIHKKSHHPHLQWEEVPEFLEKVSLNSCNSHPFAQMATKFMLMSFLRAGALTRLEWDWINWDKKLMTIDGSSSGLKRKKGRNDDIPHHVPITPQMEKLLDRAKRFNNGEKYIFLPLMESRFPHLDPSAPNNFIRNLGYKDKLRAHGWRSVALTNGIDLLKTPKEVIKRQMGHLPDNKVDQAYDKSLMLEERREFLNKWCDLLVKNGLEI